MAAVAAPEYVRKPGLLGEIARRGDKKSFERALADLQAAAAASQRAAALAAEDEDAPPLPVFTVASEINFPDLDGWAPLHFAARFDQPVLVEALLAAGAEADLPSSHGRTPLFYAARAGNHKVCSLLVEAGADAKKQDSTGSAPVDVAIDTCKGLLRDGEVEAEEAEEPQV